MMRRGADMRTMNWTPALVGGGLLLALHLFDKISAGLEAAKLGLLP